MFGWSALNKGMFYKAGQLISANRAYIISMQYLMIHLGFDKDGNITKRNHHIHH